MKLTIKPTEKQTGRTDEGIYPTVSVHLPDGAGLDPVLDAFKTLLIGYGFHHQAVMDAFVNEGGDPVLDGLTD